MKKLFIWMLCIALALSNMPGLAAYAAEGEEETASESVQETESEKVSRKISADRKKISFGTITAGDQVEPEEFSIRNDGTVPVYVNWSQADSNQAFEVSALSDTNQELAPGKSLDFQVSLNDVSAGDYTMNLHFQDEDDPPAETTVSVSVKVKEAEKKEEVLETEDGEEPEDTSEAAEESEAIEVHSLKTVCEPEDGGYACGGGLFSDTDQALLVAFADEGYVFTGWYLGDTLVTEDSNLSVQDIHSDLTYIARFKKVAFRIKAVSKNKKYGTAAGGGSFSEGDSTELTASPKEGYVFAGWYEDRELVSDEMNYTITDIDDNHTFTAVFKPVKHTLNVSAYPKNAGKVTGAGKYDHNSSAKLKAEPMDGYVFKGYYINKNLVTESPSYTIKKLSKDVSVTAYFEKEEGKTYVITSGIANKGGAISPSGEQTCAEHGNMTYTFAPDNGYAVQEVSVDGKKIGAVQSYTFSDITEDHKISVAFAPVKGNEKKVKKDPIITEAEAEKIAVAHLQKAGEDSEGRYSDIITPEEYTRMKKEGTLEEALKIPDQEIVGMDDAESLPEEVSEYNYNEAKGLYQKLDITPEEAQKMIENGEDEIILRTAYEEGLLTILINNQYIIPGQEKEIEDIFEDSSTVKNMLEFVSGVLSEKDEIFLLSGKEIAVTFGITRNDDFTEEEKKLMDKSGAQANEYFHMTVMKQRKGKISRLVTQLRKPVEVTLPCPEDTGTDCIIRLHDGSTEILPDLDNDPETITIRTDKFSPYAFATIKDKTGVMPYIAAAVILLFAVLAGVLLKKRRKI